MKNPFALPAILLDECLPEKSFRDCFTAKGHTVLLVGGVVPKGAPDRQLLVVAEQEHAVIVSSDKHWRGLINGDKVKNGEVINAGRMLIECPPVHAIERLRALYHDAEWECYRAALNQRPLILHITATRFIVDK